MHHPTPCPRPDKSRKQTQRRRLKIQNLETRLLLAADPEAFGYNSFPAPTSEALLAIMVDYSDRNFASHQTQEYYDRMIFNSAGTESFSVADYFDKTSFGELGFEPADDRSGSVGRDGFVSITMQDDSETSVDESRFDVTRRAGGAIGESILYAQFQSPLYGNFLQAKNGGGGAVAADYVSDSEGTVSAALSWENFKFIDINGGNLEYGDPVRVKTFDDSYWTIDAAGKLTATASVPADAEVFQILSADGVSGRINGASNNIPIRIQASDGRFLRDQDRVAGRPTVDVFLTGTSGPETVFQLEPSLISDSKFFGDVMASASAAGFFFQTFDTDSSGTVELGNELHTLVIEARQDEGGAVRGVQTNSAGSVLVSGRSAGIGDRATFSTIAHELSHLLHTQDIYGASCLSNRMTLMSCTGYIDDIPLTPEIEAGFFQLDAWNAIKFGYEFPRIIDLAEIAEGESVAQPVSSDPLIVYDSSNGMNEFYVFEERGNAPTQYDRDFGGSRLVPKGLAVWYVQTDSSFISPQIPNLQDPEKNDAAVFAIGHNRRFLGDPNDPKSRGALLELDPAEGLVTPADRLWREGDYRLKWLATDSSPGADLGALFHLEPNVAGVYEVEVLKSASAGAGGDPYVTEFTGTGRDDTWLVRENDGFIEVYGMDEIRDGFIGKPLPNLPLYKVAVSEFGSRNLTFTGFGGNDRLIVNHVYSDVLLAGGEIHFNGDSNDTLEIQGRQTRTYSISENQVSSTGLTPVNFDGIGELLFQGWGGSDTIDFAPAPGTTGVDAKITIATYYGDDVIDASQLPQGVSIDGGYAADTVTGTAFDDRIIVGIGDDQVDGGRGDDVYEIPLSPDGAAYTAASFSISDPAGWDQLDFLESPYPISIDLSIRRGESQIIAPSEDPTRMNQMALNGLFEYVRGSRHDDELTGSLLSEWLEGDEGSDTIEGGGGDDDLLVQGHILTVGGTVPENQLSELISHANDVLPEADAIVFDKANWDTTIDFAMGAFSVVLPVITDSLQIVGPPLDFFGMPRLELRVARSRTFLFADSDASSDEPSIDVAIRNLKLDAQQNLNEPRFPTIRSNENIRLTNLILDNSPTENSGPGLDIYGSQEYVIIDNVRVSRHGASDHFGGGVNLRIDQRPGQEIRIIDSHIDENVSSTLGGGIYIDKFSTSDPLSKAADVWIERTQIERNRAGLGGGGIYVAGGGLLVLKDSEVGSNLTGLDGGGVYRSDGDTVIINSTFSNNLAGRNGGGALFEGGDVQLTNVTLTQNGADWSSLNSDPAIMGVGGGFASAASSLRLNNTIVAGNYAKSLSNASDISGSVDSDSQFNLIGDANSSSSLVHGVGSNLVGNSGSGVIDVNTVLNSVRSNNGGPTRTHALVYPGPAIDAGSVARASVTLRNGEVITPLWDQRGTAFRRFVNAGIGVFGDPDIGAYEHQNVFHVDRGDDRVPGLDFGVPGVTLRDAAEAANSNPGPDSIQFDPAIHDTFITLTEGQIRVTDAVSVVGPGADRINIVAPIDDRIFDIDVPDAVGEVVLSGVTLRGGRSISGGGAIRSDANLSLQDVTAVDNQSQRDGGAIFVVPGSRLELISSRLIGNDAGMTADGPATNPYSGGGIFVGEAASLRVINSTLEENTANGSGGGIGASAPVSSIGVVNSTLSANLAKLDGGGIFSAFGSVHVANSTLSRNDAQQFGGAIGVPAGALRLTSTTIALNTAGSQGGGLLTPTDKTTLLYNTLLVGNESPAGAQDSIVGDIDLASANNLFDTSDSTFTGGIIDGANNNIAGPKGGGVLPVSSVIDPVLEYAGGSNLSHTLVLASLAIDAGENMFALDDQGKAITEDQRGGQFNRIVGAAIDIGASEFLSGPTSLIAGKVIYAGSQFGDESDNSKRPLTAGQTATFANYTGSHSGIIKVTLDVLNPSTDLTLADFGFRRGNTQNPGQWPSWPQPTEFKVDKQGGSGGADRITLTWNEENAVKNAWLEVMVLANKNTGLDSPQAHYWGNQIGETGNSPTDTRVNALDAGLVINNNTGFGLTGISNPHDINKDGRVNALDVGLIVNNNTAFSSLVLLSPPSTNQAARTGASQGRSTDINGNGFTSASDALTIINFLARSNRIESELSLSADSNRMDVNQDGQVSASDALHVINAIATEQNLSRKIDAERVDFLWIRFGEPENELEGIEETNLSLF